MPRLLNFLIDPFVELKRHEVKVVRTGSAGCKPAPSREMDIHVAGLACTSI